MKKQMLFKTKGMNRDLSVSAFNSEFSFENMNLRLSTNEYNTLLSWVNERGTEEVDTISIDVYPWMTDAEWEDYEELHPGASRTANVISGTPIGSTVINHQLVVFTSDTSNGGHTDRIYVLTYNKENNSIAGSCLFAGNLNFDYQHPIECLVSYEAEDIQKVYWVDGRNQPRLINIKASKEKIAEWNNNTETICSSFDFVVTMSATGSIEVTKIDGSGTFAASVIQYAFCYINKYGQQSNIVDISPLYYASHADRGGAPDGDDPVGCSFKINLSNLDSNYSTARLYSIQRTSLNGTPVVKYLDDIEIKGIANPEYIDSGVNGTIVDATSLLYVGGKVIIAETIAEKDKTLFLGNITESIYNVDTLQAYFKSLSEQAAKVTFANGGNKVINYNDPTGSIYSNTNTLSNSQWKISTFKGGENYRFGFQLRDHRGVWTNPIYIGDFTSDKYPKTSIGDNIDDNTAELVYASKTLSVSDLIDHYDGDFSVFDMIRPVIVHPSMADRKVLYQGVLNPTVFNAHERYVGTGITSQPSWFFRPWYNDAPPSPASGAFPNYLHYASLPKDTMYNNTIDDRRKVEIMGGEINYDSPYDQTDNNAGGDNSIDKCNSQFFVDQSIVTLDSPDLQLGNEVSSFPTQNSKLRIVGIIPITANCSDYDINVSSASSTIAEKVIKSFSVVNKGVFSGYRLVSDYLWHDSFMVQHNGVFVMGPTISEPYKTRYVSENQNYDGYIYDQPNPYGGVVNTVANYLIYSWRAKRSLTNDWYQNTAMLDTKIMATQLYSSNSYYFSSGGIDTPYYDNNSIDLKIHYFENNQAMQLLPQASGSNNTYNGIIDYNISKFGYKSAFDTEINENWPWVDSDHNTYDASNEEDAYGCAKYWCWLLGSDVNITVPMRYKSATHAVISFKAHNGSIPILPSIFRRAGLTLYNYNEYIEPAEARTSNYRTFWGDTLQFSQEVIDGTGILDRILQFPGLYLAEVYRDVVTPFGGTSANALASNTWQIGGNAIPIPMPTEQTPNPSVTLVWENGDTFYQRYDCMKTLPYSTEDVNQNTEILSFLCETRVNLDGRYDANRVTNASILKRIGETNFNLINPVYSQEDNYFTSRIVNNEDITSFHYPNYVYYSRTKTPGEDVDAYTNIVLSSVLELDGDKGEIRAIRKLNNHLFTFQDSGISRIMFNDNVQIQSTEGVPIEIANSGKVLGKDYISNTVGCSNKWSIVQTPNGIYFMDSNDKSIYLFNGQLDNISSKNGFNTWCKQNIPASDIPWNPVDFDNFVGHYDRQNQEVLYVNSEKALAWNEKLGAFTSFYDYGNSPFFANLKDVGLWIRSNDSNSSIWRHQAGDYCTFFGENKPYWITLVGNSEPQLDKTFTNLEFRACVEGDGTVTDNKFTPTLPFDSLETWNEYQHGRTALENKNGHSAMVHGGSSSALKRKFRIWRCDIPRDNFTFMTYPVQEQGETEADYQQRVDEYNDWLAKEQSKGIYRTNRHINDRMRNPWLYLKLMKNIPNSGSLPKTEIHDVMMTYFG